MLSNGDFGIWDVNGVPFYDKREALIYASQKGCPPISYKYYDNVFDSFDRKLLGTKNLDQLYRERALMLREEYDYLILCFSGGIDSYNILQVFLENNIKLDHIYTFWPISAKKANIYTPNKNDTSAANMLSEWDYAIEPVLKYISKFHPEIKIEITDWVEDLDENLYNDDSLLLVPQYSGLGSIPRNTSISKIGRSLVDKGLKVASLFGYDKPLVLQKNKKPYMLFYDTAMISSNNTVGEFEPFYWTPKMPHLAFEMANSVWNHYKQNPDLKKYMFGDTKEVSPETAYQFNIDLGKKICYPRHYNKIAFQTMKSNSALRQDRDFWLYTLPDFQKLKEVWRYYQQNVYDGINPIYYNKSIDYFKDPSQTESITLKATTSKYFGLE